ncbi:MAG: hypothetical protein AAF578_14840 [Pseudomonadota bacterium]
MEFSKISARIKSASDAGLSQAQMEHADFIASTTDPKEPPNEAKIELYLGLMQSAKDQGNADAFFYLGLRELNLGGAETRVRAIANLMVAESVYREFGIRTNIAVLIDRHYRLLYPGERAAARLLAEELSSVESCCEVVYGKTWAEKLGEQ